MTKFKVMIALAALMVPSWRAYQVSKQVVIGCVTSILSSQATLTQSSFRQVGVVAEPKVEQSRAPVRQERTSPVRLVKYGETIASSESGCGTRIDRQGNVFIVTNPKPGVVSLDG